MADRPARKRPIRVPCPLSTEEHARVEAEARRLGVPLGTYLRMAALRLLGALRTVRPEGREEEDDVRSGD